MLLQRRVSNFVSSRSKYDGQSPSPIWVRVETSRHLKRDKELAESLIFLDFVLKLKRVCFPNSYIIFPSTEADTQDRQIFSNDGLVCFETLGESHPAPPLSPAMLLSPVMKTSPLLLLGNRGIEQEFYSWGLATK